jgi:holo-[acyl-carrier protein] synthase
MIGLDILHLPRIQALLLRRTGNTQRFITRILHPNERNSLPSDEVSLVRFLGTRFAAKEAAYKAFQPRIRVSWKELEVWKHESGRAVQGGLADVGKPYLRTWRGARKVDYPLSISHEKEYVVAVVMDTPIWGIEETD